MANLDPRRVPAATTEITYTGRGGVQVSLEIERKGKYAYVTPETDFDVVALDALGYTTVANKAKDEEKPAATADGADEAPSDGGKE